MSIEFPPPTAPYEVAKTLYSDHHLSDRMTHLAAWRGGWMAWHTSHWAEIDAADLRQAIYASLGDATYCFAAKDGPEERPWNPDKRKVANVIEALAAVVHLPSETDPPAWITTHDAAESPAPQIISCSNGLLNLSTRTTFDHTPALFNLVSVPFDYQPDAPEPATWLQFLASVWPDDPDSIALLQEFFGYVLSGRLDMQKLLMLIGPTRSGKGTIGRILGALMGGNRNVAGPTLASLSTNFGLAPLVGKPLAIVSDARLGNIPSHAVVERLLSITGEDMLTIDRKFREQWTGKLPTRFVVLSNELPRFKDSSGAIANRIVILHMTTSFLGREDHELDDKLTDELPGILSWALQGLDRLNREGRFTVPASSKDAAVLMMDLASPVSAFVRDRCEHTPGSRVLRDDLYEAWKTWATDNGHHHGAKSTFGRDLRAVVPEVKDSRSRIEGVQAWCYTHIALLPDSPVSPQDEATETGAETGTETGKNASFGTINPQLDRGETGETGQTPAIGTTLAGETGSVPVSGTKSRRFKPPVGEGRCTECGFHTSTQRGHREGCSKQ